MERSTAYSSLFDELVHLRLLRLTGAAKANGELARRPRSHPKDSDPETLAATVLKGTAGTMLAKKEGSMTNQEIRDDPVQEPTSQTVHDPVCHMDIIASSSAGNSEYEGKTYYFCSTSCTAEFNADPAGVLKMEAEYHRN